jgi:hypothetical protein
MNANTPLRKEGTGYPTQKPERLLERIIRAASRPGQTVADLMCGSGTTLVVAARLGRRFVGGDSSALAIETTTRRLEAARAPFRLVASDRPPNRRFSGKARAKPGTTEVTRMLRPRSQLARARLGRFLPALHGKPLRQAHEARASRPQGNAAAPASRARLPGPRPRRSAKPADKPAKLRHRHPRPSPMSKATLGTAFGW